MNNTQTGNVDWCFTHFISIFMRSTTQYDTRCYFNVRSKADTSQLNLQQKSAKTEEEKLKRKNGYAQK